MFYYLTEQRPPVKNFWLANNVVEVDELFSSLEESIAKKKKYPMIIDTKQNIMGEVGQIKLNNFLKKFSYFSNDNNKSFTIWMTDLE